MLPRIVPRHAACISQCSTSSFENSCGYAALDMPESREISDRADSLAGKPTTTSSLRLKRSDVLRSLKHCLLAQSLGHHSIDCLEECLRVVERGSARRSSLKGRERAIRGRWTVFVERTREGHRQSDEQLSLFQRQLWKNSSQF